MSPQNLTFGEVVEIWILAAQRKEKREKNQDGKSINTKLLSAFQGQVNYFLPMTQRSGRQSVIQLTTLWPNVSRDDNNLRSFHDGKLSPFVFLSCPKKVPRGSLIICRFLPIGFLHLLKKKSHFLPAFPCTKFWPFLSYSFCRRNSLRTESSRSNRA